MNERKCSDVKCVRKPTRSRLSLNTPCKQIQPLSRVKSLDGPRVRGISPVGNKKVYGGKDLLKSPVSGIRVKNNIGVVFNSDNIS